jgi:sulfur carrier protein
MTTPAAQAGAAPATLNGEALGELPGSILELVQARTGRELGADGTPVGGGRLGVAVALNQEVLPRRRWAETPVRAGDAIELLTAVQGG